MARKWSAFTQELDAQSIDPDEDFLAAVDADALDAVKNKKLYIGKGLLAAPRHYAEKTADYTFVLLDGGRTRVANSATDVTFTVPLNATVPFAQNQIIEVGNIGAGDLYLAGDSFVVLNVAPGGDLIFQQYEFGVLRYLGSDEWVLNRYA